MQQKFDKKKTTKKPETTENVAQHWARKIHYVETSVNKSGTSFVSEIIKIWCWTSWPNAV